LEDLIIRAMPANLNKMVVINDFTEQIELLHEGVVIGVLSNIMQLQDIRVQIRRNQLSGYSIRHNGNLIHIGNGGQFQPGLSKLVPFYKKWADMCSELF